MKLKTLRIPPSGGKLWLAKSEPDLYVDSDVMLEDMDFESTKKGAEEASASDEMTLQRIEEYVGEKTLLSNFDMTWMTGESPNNYDQKVYAYRPHDYVEHIKKAGRDDLLENFSQTELEQWMYDINDVDTFLKPGQFIADILT